MEVLIFLKNVCNVIVLKLQLILNKYYLYTLISSINYKSNESN